MASKPTVVLTITEVARRGGLARLKTMTPEQRSEIARKAARARWAAKNSPDPNDTNVLDGLPRPIRDSNKYSVKLGRRRPQPCHSTRTTRKSSAFFNLNLFELESQLAVA